jgi:transposase
MESLSVAADGGVPVQFRCADGRMADSRTHIETCNALRAVAGRAIFLYVADSKLRNARRRAETRASTQQLDPVHDRHPGLLA